MPDIGPGAKDGVAVGYDRCGDGNKYCEVVSMNLFCRMRIKAGKIVSEDWR